MPPRDLASLDDILRSAERIREATTQVDFSEFTQNWILHQAVTRELEIIGEATKRLSAPLRQLHPQVPWSEMSRLRDRLIHSYDRVDLTIVWDIVQGDIPALIPLIRRMMTELASGQE